MPDQPSRRSLLGGGTALIGLGVLESQQVAAQTASPSPDTMIVTLLGTGSPAPSPISFGEATLVQAGTTALLFSAGRGCTIRLAQAGAGLGNINAVFLTHFHSDHTNGLGDLFTLGYIARRAPTGNSAILSYRTGPLRLWGPTGVTKVARGTEAAASEDIRMRIPDEHLNPAATRIEDHEFSGEGVVFDENDVRVTAFKVDTGPLVRPAYGYRIDYRGRSALISGETHLSENLIAHGQGVDLIVHDLAAVAPKWLDDPQASITASRHASPEDCGTVFARTKPKMGTFTHIILQDVTPAEVVARVRTKYDGPIEFGRDLTRFVIGDDVTVKRWNSQTGGYPG